MTDLSPPYIIENEDGLHPFVFNSPHSGRVYPEAFLDASRLDALTIRKSEDSFVEDLFMPVVKHGATLIHALFPRAFVDLNREPFELDPQLFTETLPEFANTQSVRVLGGLGTIARVVTDSEEIYENAPSLEEAIERINCYYVPYHRALTQLLEAAKRRFGYAILVDCHSMPTLSTMRNAEKKPDFVLGDRYGASCDGAIIRTAEELLRDLGYMVVRNVPYAGGYATEHYGKPECNVHALQVEINRGLYMNEQTFEKLPRFDKIRQDLEIFSRAMLDLVPQAFGGRQLAAE